MQTVPKQTENMVPQKQVPRLTQEQIERIAAGPRIQTQVIETFSQMLKVTSGLIQFDALRRAVECDLERIVEASVAGQAPKSVLHAQPEIVDAPFILTQEQPRAPG